MLYYLENSRLKVSVESFGAEIKSIKNKEKADREYMWCADGTYWKRTSPILFPLVGSLNNQTYSYDGKEYHMSQHGFARDMEFCLDKQTKNSLEFVLRDTDNTREKYPFSFELRIGYTLEENTVTVKWSVENTDTKDIYFSIGGHPAFNCPVNENEKQTECSIEFDTKDEIVASVIGEGGTLTKQKKVYKLQDGILNITENLFDDDALIIENDQAHKVSLRDSKKNPYVTLEFAAPLFGLWSPAGKNAPFICIEPWYGRCDASDFNGTLEQREWGNHLKPEDIFNVSYKITLE